MLSKLKETFRFANAQVTELGLGAAIHYKMQRLKARRSGHRGPYQLRSRYVSAPVWVRPDSSDLMVFDQIFVEREYRCLDDIEDAGFILDCGANVGFASAYLLSRFPRARLVAIEPESGNFEALRRNTEAFGDRVQLLRAGVWSHPADLVVERHDTRAGEEWAFTVREAQPGEQADVRATDLTSVWQSAGSPTISILKMDIEGSEAVVFAAESKPWLDHVESLVIELHGDHCDAALQKAIRGMGFAISSCGELTVCKRRLPRR